MYKKYTIEELFEIKTKFLEHLRSILYKKKAPTLKAYLKDMSKQGEKVYFFQKSQPVFSIKYVGGKQKDEKTNESILYIFYDEEEKIELHATEKILTILHDLLKDKSKIEKKLANAKKMEKILWNAFAEGEFGSIFGKPYLVYDIETTAATNDLMQTKFYFGYTYVVTGPKKGKYKYIGTENLEAFVRYMVDFDGYVVGFNNIGFDNPVCVYNCSNRTQEMLEKINKKSIDLFLFVWNLTKTRISLNKLSSALVGIEKTLRSGTEGEALMQKYKETGDEKYLKEFQNYCKNDVEMTLLTLWYLLKYQKLYLDGQEYTYTLDEFLTMSQTPPNTEKKEEKTDEGLF